MTSTTLQEPNTAQDRSLDPARLPASRRRSRARSPELGGDGRRSVPALLVDRVTKRFKCRRKKRPVVAIDDVSLRLERGGTIGILGANGSGKSTLIRLVSGLLTLDEGRVEVFGHDIVREEMAVKRLINRVSVDAAFFKKLSPMENLLFAARLYGIDPKLARRETVRITERLGIAEKRLGRPVEQMSRGMQQKIAIARALLTSPSLLLLDEPTTGLDPRSKLDVQTFIEEIRDEPRRIDRPDDARPRRGRAAVRRDHRPQRRPDRRPGLAGGAQATRRRAPRRGTDDARRVHDLHRPLPRRGRRGRRVGRRRRMTHYQRREVRTRC